MKKNLTQPVKPRLILLSDLWGIENSGWLAYYRSCLQNQFEISEYDSCVLGEVNKTVPLEKTLHDRFVNGGIEKAVKNILKLETDSINILGFSIGGYIAWKAGLSGLKIKNYYGVSSTRLRKEYQKPQGNLELFFGEKDAYIPDSKWFKKMNLKAHFFKGGDHNFYMNKEIAKFISDTINSHLQ